MKERLLEILSEFCREHPVDEKATDGVVEVSFNSFERDPHGVYFMVSDLLNFKLVEVVFTLGVLEKGALTAEVSVVDDGMRHRVLVQQRIKALQLTLKMLDKVADEIQTSVQF